MARTFYRSRRLFTGLDEEPRHDQTLRTSAHAAVGSVE